ncbi:hypothetical protein GALMADRAFT_593838 [Galerina marginata CBS 339.88]|uniref:BTB domain-containing protein n=1 Tax=Galerina marginata (strain CBS 339.88) TaxID=685588 RepID=A0A067SSP9_GALM3|nr:hypothetical protein GALMADRAFT_593838 [Galerina marginata CBS 339.88]
MDSGRDRAVQDYNALVSSCYPTPPYSQFHLIPYVADVRVALAIQSVPKTSNLPLTTTPKGPSEDQPAPPHDPLDDVISISTVFHPGTHPPPNTICSSSDNVFFYVSSEVILLSSPTAFQPYLSAPLSDPQYRDMVIAVDAPSDELNVIMHALYRTSPASHLPDFETISRSIDRMPHYGLSPQALIKPSTPLYDLLLSHAPLHPLEVYALGAHHQIHALASTVSSHLLSHNLSTVSDEMAERIGPIYLNRLFLLHVGRFTALKKILLYAPHPHPPTKDCDFDDQKKLTRAWALVVAHLVWDAKPDLSTLTLGNALNPLLEHLACTSCKQSLRGRIKDVMVQWTSVQRTI